MRRHLRKLAAVPTALVLTIGVTACDDGGETGETTEDGGADTVVEGGEGDGEDQPADLEGDVDAGAGAGSGASEDVDPEADADAEVETDGEQDS